METSLEKLKAKIEKLKAQQEKIEAKQKYIKPKPIDGQKPHSSNMQVSKSYGSKLHGGGFEDMLSKFLKDSDEKLKSMKKNASNRRGNGFNRKAD